MGSVRASLGVALVAIFVPVGASGSGPPPDALAAVDPLVVARQRLEQLEARAGAASSSDAVDREVDAALALAAQLSARDRRAEAADLLAARLERAERASADRRLELWTTLARVWAELGRFREAEARLAEAERLAAGRPPRLQMTLEEAWGDLHFYRLEPRIALEHRERAARIALEVGDSEDAVRLYTNLGLTRIQLHDYTTALADLDRARSALESPTDRQRIPILHGLGIAAFELRRLDRAERAFAELTTIAERLESPRLLSVGVGELALVAMERGDVEGALAGLDRAIELSRIAGDTNNEVAWWMNRGKADRDRGRFEQALASYRRAEELLSRMPGRAEANLFKHMGQCEAGLGRDDRALALFARALEAAGGSGDRKVLWETWRELGRLHRRRGDREAAERSYLAALEQLESLRDGLRIESFKTDFFEDKVRVYEEAVALFAERAPDGPRASFEIAERARARAFLDTLAASAADLHQTLPAALRDEERRLLDDVSRRQAEIRLGGSDQAIARLADAERALEALAVRASVELPRYRAMQGLDPADLDEVQAALAPGELMLAYLLGTDGSHLWVVDRRRAELHPLPPKAEVEAAALDAYAGIASPAGALEPLLGFAEILLGPAVDALGAASSLVVVPSGALFYVPFEPLPEPGGAVLGERWPVTYVPSASVLVELRRRAASPRSPRALVLADPAAGPGEAAAVRGIPLGATGQLGRLPFTRREAEVLERLLGDRATVLAGADASEQRLRAEPLSSYSLLHFGTHGVIDAGEPSRSALLLAPPAPGDRESDGFLVPREIVRLELDADLVTLSACQSALGSVVSGEGMVSLARSFLYAGTPTVVASLWSVNDRASSVLMGHFYEALAAGSGRAEALSLAKRATRAEHRYRHPHYWAGFVLIGEGEGSVAFPPRPRRWTSIAAPAALAAALFLAAAWTWRRRTPTGPRGPIS